MEMLSAKRSGAVLLLMLLIIVVVCGILWLDPSALFHKSDPSLPWNQEDRLVGSQEKVGKPTEEQPNFKEFLSLETTVRSKNTKCGEVAFTVKPNGRIEGAWSGEFDPRPNVNYLVMGGNFKGNIVPSKVYSENDGVDKSMLYFLTKGDFLIVETYKKKKRVRKVSGNIYVTGWINPQYNVTGELLITSNKRDFEKYFFESELEPGLMFFRSGNFNLKSFLKKNKR